MADAAFESWPELFRAALAGRIALEAVRVNEDDDEGWMLTASHQGDFFRVCCRSELFGEGVDVDHVLWCEGVKRSVLSIFDKILPPSPAVVAAIEDVLNNHVQAMRVERVAE